jgi:hypothetical protein
MVAMLYLYVVMYSWDGGHALILLRSPSLVFALSLDPVSPPFVVWTPPSGFMLI